MKQKKVKESDNKEVKQKMLTGEISIHKAYRSPWTEPEMQKLLEVIAEPDEGLGDYFPRRKL